LIDLFIAAAKTSMSRHRNVKQLVDEDYYDDYDDDYYDDGYDDYDDYTGGSAQVQQTKKKESAAASAYS